MAAGAVSQIQKVPARWQMLRQVTEQDGALQVTCATPFSSQDEKRKGLELLLETYKRNSQVTGAEGPALQT